MQHPIDTAPTPAPATMDDYRNAAFRARVAARLEAAKSAGQPAQTILAQIAREQRALAEALMDPELITIAGQTLRKEQANINAKERYQSTPTNAHEAMHQIMKRRAAEALEFAAIVEKPENAAMLSALSAQEAHAAIPDLRAVKLHDTLDELMHMEGGKPQVIAHIDAAAKGAMFEHDALATTYAAAGPLHDALMKSLGKHLPDSTREDIHRVASQWLHDREAAAKVTSQLSSNTGEAYLEAVRQSTEYHRLATKTSEPAGEALAATTTADGGSAARRKTLRELEKEKTANQRAEDVAYTINHALSCGTTDVVLQPVIAAAFGGALNVGCAGHHNPTEKLTFKETLSKFSLKNLSSMSWKQFGKDAGHYLKGEIFGDFVAVPLTIFVQRNFPNFMNGLRKITEPLFGWAFRGGANRTASQWGQERGLSADAPEVQAQANKIYEHEIAHLPQAVVWNMFAYPLGAVAQKVTGHDHTWGQIFQSKLVGAVISNSILIGGRMVAPGAAQKWDALTGDKIFAPISKGVGKLFGVDEKTMEKAMEKQHPTTAKAWAERVDAEQTQTQPSAGASVQ